MREDQDPVRWERLQRVLDRLHRVALAGVAARGDALGAERLDALLLDLPGPFDGLVDIVNPEADAALLERRRHQHHLGAVEVDAAGEGVTQLLGGDRLAGQDEQLHGRARGYPRRAVATRTPGVARPRW